MINFVSKLQMLVADLKIVCLKNCILRQIKNRLANCFVAEKSRYSTSIFAYIYDFSHMLKIIINNAFV